MKRYLLAIGWSVSLLATSCETLMSPQKKGTLTTEMRGADYLTNKGDELMRTGIYSKQDVSPAFAAGVEKGELDVIKELYWQHQYQQWLMQSGRAPHLHSRQ